MLQHLRVNNLALIDELELSFDQGLNVITGETGAGKSLLMQAILLAVGGRASAELVRHQAQEAVVEAVFSVSDARVARLLAESGSAADEEVVIRRVISHNGRGRVYLNGVLSPVAVLRQLGEYLLHIYGQHEQQMLLESEAALRLLDGFAGLGPQVEELERRYHTVRQLWSQVRALTEAKEAAQTRRELLRFQIDEIERAALRPGEEEALRQEKAVLVNVAKLVQGVTAAEEILASGEQAVTDRLGWVLTRLRELSRIDGHLSGIVALLESGLAHVEEAAHALGKYGERLTVNPERLEEIEVRLTLLSRLKSKYGGSVEAILAHRTALARELQQLESGEEVLAARRKELGDATEEAWELAQALSRARSAAAQVLEARMVEELAALGMQGACFAVRFVDAGGDSETTGEAPFVRGGRRLRPTGCDQVQFYLSANPGEPPLPLAQVASGGELSRLMLALKVLGAAAEEAPTLIFDEVDAGIGGAVAEVVGRRLKAVARQRQVLCITHLPHIAAYADHAYTVVKTVVRGRTISRAKRLGPEERLHELARMLGGIEITPEARRHAREMLEGARRG